MRWWAKQRAHPGASIPRRLSAWSALPLAAIGGYLLDVATPGIEWWPAAILGASLIMLAVWQQPALRGLIVGLLAGAAFWFPHISWLTLYLGPIPWLALGTVMMLWFGLFGLGAALATKGIAHLRIPPLFLVAVQAMTVTGLWVIREQVQSTWPYGGFAWGRLAHTQARGPLAETVAWVGFTGLTALIALACACAVGLFFIATGPREIHVRRRGMVFSLAGVIAVLLAASAVPIPVLPETGSLRVAAVQGNSKSGIFDDRDSGDVLSDHLKVTERLVEDLESTGERVDIIVWPENSAEFDFPRRGFERPQLSRLSRLADAPIVIGSVLPRDGGIYTNSTLVWGPDGEVQDGAGETLQYDKRYPVPFAEYMPHRSFYHALVPDLVDLVQLEYAAGTLPAAFDVPLRTGNVAAGLAICFDIIFDGQSTAMINDGAEVILAQTNNADFGRTDESAQQLQIAHLRAIETGRSLVNISTVGTSAIVHSDGSEVDRLEPFTADYMVAEVPLYDGKTPALLYGSLITAFWIMIGLAGVGLAVLVQWARRRGRWSRLLRGTPPLTEQL